jgi:hypothetical protein
LGRGINSSDKLGFFAMAVEPAVLLDARAEVLLDARDARYPQAGRGGALPVLK